MKKNRVKNVAAALPQSKAKDKSKSFYRETTTIFEYLYDVAVALKGERTTKKNNWKMWRFPVVFSSRNNSQKCYLKWIYLILQRNGRQLKRLIK